MKYNHAYHQLDLPLSAQILNISVNMARMGNWTLGLFDLAKDKDKQVYQARIKLINKLKIQTDTYLNDLYSNELSDQFKPTLKIFKRDFDIFKKQPITEENYLYWSEKALTWADILQIRAKLA